MKALRILNDNVEKEISLPCLVHGKNLLSKKTTVLPKDEIGNTAKISIDDECNVIYYDRIKYKTIDNTNFDFEISEYDSDVLVLYNDNTTIKFSGNCQTIDEFCFFDGMEKITKIILPNTIQTIDDESFSHFINLREITIPNSVEYIGNNILLNTFIVRDKFYCPQNLEPELNDYWGATLCDKITNDTLCINNNKIVNVINKTLLTYTIPSDVSGISEGAFYNCSAITNLTIPSNVTSIEDMAFYDCTNLSSITLPNSINAFTFSCFGNCSNLSKINFPSSLQTIGEEAFANCINLSNIILPIGLEMIEDNAFENCSSLSSVTIPQTLELMSNTSFANAIVEKVMFNSDYNDFTPVDVFGSFLVEFIYNNNITEIPMNAFYECEMLTHVQIPSSVTSIGDNAFYGCSSLTNITLPPSLSAISNQMFASSNLTHVNIPSGVTKIGSSAFYKSNLTSSLRISENVTTIGSYAFADCNNLTEVILPENLTSLGTLLFENCSSLTSIKFTSHAPTFNENTFSNIISHGIIYIPQIYQNEYSHIISNIQHHYTYEWVVETY